MYKNSKYFQYHVRISNLMSNVKMTKRSMSIWEHLHLFMYICPVEVVVFFYTFFIHSWLPYSWLKLRVCLLTFLQLDVIRACKKHVCLSFNPYCDLHNHEPIFTFNLRLIWIYTVRHLSLLWCRGFIIS